MDKLYVQMSLVELERPRTESSKNTHEVSKAPPTGLTRFSIFSPLPRPAGSCPPGPVPEGVIRIYSMRFCPYSHRTRLVLKAKGIR